MKSEITVRHNLLVLSINKSVTSGSDIYEAARYAWKLKIERARQAELVIAHQKGLVVGVFRVDEWLPAEDQAFSDRFSEEQAGRWGFVGQVAEPEILEDYLNKLLPKGFTKRGASNPVRFLDPANLPGGQRLLTDPEDQAASTQGGNPSSRPEPTIQQVEAKIDSDGDLSVSLNFDLSQFDKVERQHPLYVVANMQMEAQGRINDDVAFHRNGSVAEDRSVEFHSGFMRVPELSNCEVKVNGELSVLGFTKVAEAVFVLRVAEEPIELINTGEEVKIKECAFDFDEDGYLCISVDVDTTRDAVAICIASRDEECFSVSLCDDGSGYVSDGLFDLAEGEEVTLQILVSTDELYSGEYQWKGLAIAEDISEGTGTNFMDISTPGGSYPHKICLTFGGLLPTEIETKHGQWLDDSTEVGNFRFDAIAESGEAFEKAVRDSLTLDFDGDLDNPERFKEITLLGLYGPRHVSYEVEGLCLSNVSFYLEVVTAEEGLQEYDFEDIFHLIRPVVKMEGVSYYLGEFSDYSVVFEDVSEGVLPLSGGWKNEVSFASEDINDVLSLDSDLFFEVVVPDEELVEWFYWVECDDEDDACEAALKKHEELERPAVFEDFDKGIFPGAYQPVIEENRRVAVIIRAEELD